jgi:hypothetical protein
VEDSLVAALAKMDQIAGRQQVASTRAARFDERLKAFDGYLDRLETILGRFHDNNGAP